jgi:hypothetical protein
VTEKCLLALTIKKLCVIIDDKEYTMDEGDMESLMTVTGKGDRWWHNNAVRLHRIDGPAVELVNGRKDWYLNGYLHRTCGPAINKPNGDIFWYLNGSLLFFDEWLAQTIGLTDEEKVMMKLQYG